MGTEKKVPEEKMVPEVKPETPAETEKKVPAETKKKMKKMKPKPLPEGEEPAQ